MPIYIIYIHSLYPIYPWWFAINWFADYFIPLSLPATKAYQGLYVLGRKRWGMDSWGTYTRGKSHGCGKRLVSLGKWGKDTKRCGKPMGKPGNAFGKWSTFMVGKLHVVLQIFTRGTIKIFGSCNRLNHQKPWINEQVLDLNGIVHQEYWSCT